jgi:hypothetical protein
MSIQVFNPSSSGGGGNKVTATINFGTVEDTTASITVTGQSWVTALSVIIAGFGGTTSNHGADDAMVEGLSAYVENIVPGTGFDITAHAPQGTWGNYSVYALGVA